MKFLDKLIFAWTRPRIRVVREEVKPVVKPLRPKMSADDILLNILGTQIWAMQHMARLNENDLWGMLELLHLRTAPDDPHVIIPSKEAVFKHLIDMAVVNQTDKMVELQLTDPFGKPLLNVSMGAGGITRWVARPGDGMLVFADFSFIPDAPGVDWHCVIEDIGGGNRTGVAVMNNKISYTTLYLTPG